MPRQIYKTMALPFIYKFSVYKVTHCLQAVTTFTSACGGQAGGGNTGGSKHSISYKPYVAPPDKPHDLKNMELKRPMSPHLTIYAPTLTAMTSIVQRITGVIVLSYALLLSAGTLFLSNGVETYVSVIQSLDLSRPSIVIIKILLGAPFVYHYFNGIRYCAWNAGKWLSLKEVYGTAKKSFVLTGIFTLLFAFL
ncbi:unnamed protein product [Parnassius mnemosyne]|uniref:Succinate dehydrogenase cytochrome b560 subunit, mitochondrial n=1 Tax=Parnassius mnemosyne TaxID=213953 RepID=A0AAV1L1Y8_9NEOP